MVTVDVIIVAPSRKEYVYFRMMTYVSRLLVRVAC